MVFLMKTSFPSLPIFLEVSIYLILIRTFTNVIHQTMNNIEIDVKWKLKNEDVPSGQRESSCSFSPLLYLVGTILDRFYRVQSNENRYKRSWMSAIKHTYIPNSNARFCHFYYFLRPSYSFTGSRCVTYRQ